MADEPVKEDRITRIPLVIVTVAGGHRTEGVLVGVTVEQLDALEHLARRLHTFIGSIHEIADEAINEHETDEVRLSMIRKLCVKVLTTDA